MAKWEDEYLERAKKQDEESKKKIEQWNREHAGTNYEVHGSMGIGQLPSKGGSSSSSTNSSNGVQGIREMFEKNKDTYYANFKKYTDQANSNKKATESNKNATDPNYQTPSREQTNSRTSARDTEASTFVNQKSKTSNEEDKVRFSKVKDVTKGTVKQYGASQLNAMVTPFAEGKISSSKVAAQNDLGGAGVKTTTSRKTDGATFSSDTQNKTKNEEQLKKITEDLQKRYAESVGIAQGKADSLNLSGSEDLARAYEDATPTERATLELYSNLLSWGADAGIGTVTGTGMLAPMASRSFGSSAMEARQEGASQTRQMAAGGLSAGADVVSELLFGGVGPMKKLMKTGGILDNVAEKGAYKVANSFIGKGISKETAYKLGKTLAGVAGEGIEEVVAGLAQPAIESIYREGAASEQYLHPIESGYLESLGKDFAMGSAMAGAIGTGGAVVNKVRGAESTTTSFTPEEKSEIISVAINMAEDSKARSYAQTLEKQIEKGEEVLDEQIKDLGNKIFEESTDMFDYEGAINYMGRATSQEQLDAIMENAVDNVDESSASVLNSFYMANQARIANEMQEAEQAEASVEPVAEPMTEEGIERVPVDSPSITLNEIAEGNPVEETAENTSATSDVVSRINSPSTMAVEQTETSSQPQNDEEQAFTNLTPKLAEIVQNNSYQNGEETLLKVASENYPGKDKVSFLSEYEGDPNDTTRVSLYSNGFSNFYNLGKLERNGGMTYAKAVEINRPFMEIMGTAPAYAYQLGKQSVEKQENKQTGEKKTKVSKKSKGEYTNKTKNADVTDELYRAIARKTGIEIEKEKNIFHRTAEGNVEANAKFIPELASIVISENASQEFGDAIHELGHAATEYNPEDMKVIREAIVDWYVQHEGVTSLEAMIEDTIANYGGKMSHDDALIEIQNEALAGIFSSNDGATDFIEWAMIDKDGKNIVQKFLDLLDRIYSALKEIIKTGDMSKAAMSAAQMEADRANEIRKLFLDALDRMNITENTSEESTETTSEETKTEDDTDNKFSLKQQIEENKDLIALHNITEPQMKSLLELGGIPMPSIAITKSDHGHTDFGSISMLFSKDTIDPANSDNKVYSQDAWTPIFPRIEYDVNEEELRKLATKLGSSYAYIESNAFDGSDIQTAIRKLKDLREVKNAFIEDNGISVEPVLHEPKFEHVSMGREPVIKFIKDNDITLDKLLDNDSLREEFISEISNSYDGNNKRVAKMRDFFVGQITDELEGMKDDAEIRRVLTSQWERDLETAKGSLEAVVDETSYEEGLRNALNENEEAYNRYVTELAEPVIGNAGIVNEDAETYTENGDRRSFNQLHMDYTLENIINAMRKQQPQGQAGGMFGGVSTLRGAAAEEYSSIDDIKSNSDRLQIDDDVSEKMEELSDELFEILDLVVDDSLSDLNQMFQRESIGETLAELFARKNFSKDIVQEKFAEDFENVIISDETFERIDALRTELRNLPAKYFEAKPQRAVGFDEVMAVIAPNGIDETLKKELQDKGINLYEYEENNNADRTAKVNEAADETDARFSLKESEAEQLRAVRRENARLKDIKEKQDETIAYLKLQLKRTGKKVLKRVDIHKIAVDLKKKYQSTVSTDDVINELTDIYNEMSNGATPDDVMDMGKEVANMLVKNSKLKNQRNEAYDDMIKYFKTTTIALDPTELSELENKFGKNMFGKMKFTTKTLTNQAQTIDVLWEELQSVGAVEGEYKPGAIVDIVNRVNNAYESTTTEYQLLEHDAEFVIPTEIMERYADVRSEPTYADKMAQKIEEVRKAEHDHYQSLIENKYYARATNLKKSDLRRQIKREVNGLNRKLLDNSAKRHIPDNLKSVVAKLLNAFASDTTIHGEKGGVVGSGLFPADALNSLSRIYKQYYGGNNFELESWGYDEEIEEKIGDMAEALEGRRLVNLTIEELENIKDIVTNVATIVRNQNTIFIEGKREEYEKISHKVMNENSSDKVRARWWIFGKKSFDWFRNYMKLGNMTPVYFFKRMGGTFEKLANDLLDGQDKYAVNYQSAKSTLNDIKKKRHYDDWADKKGDLLTFKDSDGNDMTITREQAMLIYATYMREQNDKDTQDSNHLLGGGFIFENAVRVKKNPKGKDSKLEWSYDDKTVHRMSVEGIDTVINWLTTEQKGYADDIVEYMSTDMANLGNEVYNELFGISFFNKKYYFPYNSSRHFLQGSLESRESMLKSMSFTKNTKPGANNPLVLSDFSTVAAKHIDSMIRYNALVVPLESMNRVFNYKVPGANASTAQGVKNTISASYGEEATNYISQFMKDVNGSVLTDPRDGMANVSISKMKRAAVMMSMSVVVQQPSSIFRAFAMVNPKYFAKTTFTKRSADEMKKYNPVAVVKAMGGFDTGVGISAIEDLLHVEPETKGQKVKAIFTDRQALDDAMGWMPQKADEITWCHIWNAVKAETKAKTGLEGEELCLAAAPRFRDVINKTQVYDSVFSRSSNMRAKSTFMKMGTAFMAEPTVYLNMYMDAFHTFRVDKSKASAKYVAKSVGAIVLATFMNAAMKAVVTAGRNPDGDDDNWLEHYIEDLTSGFLDGANPLTLFPYLRDIWSVMQGWNVERTDMSIYTDLVQGTKSMFDFIANSEDYDAEKAYKTIQNFTGGVGAVIGIPAKNVMRDLKTIYNDVNMIVNGKPLEEDSVSDAILKGLGLIDAKSETISGKVNSYKEEPTDENLKEIYEYYNKKVEEGSEKGNARSAVKSQITRAYKEDYVAGDTSERRDIRKALSKIRIDGELLYSTEDFTRWIKEAQNN